MLHRDGPTAEPLAPLAPAAAPVPVPSGFRDELVIGGLTEPTAVQFASDGRIIVGEKSGRIKIFSSPTDTNPGVYTGLQANVYDLWDRGMLGLVIDPAFTSGRPYIYVSYTYNHILGDASAAPKWANDGCPTPPGSTEDGCVASGRIDRLTVNNKSIVVAADSPKVLVEDWCQQFPSHSMGSLAFGPEGALYATGGEGASFFDVDYGQLGGTLPNTTNPVTPVNPCGDPPGGKGVAGVPPTTQGGALRSQDLRTPTQDPVGLNGTLIRISPDTGAAWPTNNLIGSPDLNARRIIAFGLRNPFRFAIRPGTDDAWIGDVGNFSYEELDEVPNPNAAPRNFGWPCFEGGSAGGGSFRNSQFDSLNVDVCEDLYDDDSETAPAFNYSHSGNVVSGDGCGTGSSSLAGVAFLGTTSGYPDAYDRALFIADYNRRCIWSIRADVNGRPDFSTRALFVNLRPLGSSLGAVHLTTAPNGDLVYVTFDTSPIPGEVRRIHWYSNLPPTASFTATPSSGPLPLAVTFDASGSTNPNPVDALTYQWDLDGDGAFDDATGQTTSRTYNAKAQVVVGLRVTSSSGLMDSTTRTIWPGYVPPTATITSPATSFRWAVGDSVPFAGTARDGSGATLPPSSMAWSVTMEHCPSDCHSHPSFFNFTGLSGSFAAPDHEYPSHLKLQLVVTDGPMSTVVSQDILPKTGIIQVRSDPPGLPLSLGANTGAPPPDATAIVGSSVTVSAPATGTLGGAQYAFSHWSDGGAAVHGVVATEATKTLTAFYNGPPPPPTPPPTPSPTPSPTPPPPPPPPVASTVFRPVDPVRLLDSRVGNGLSGVFRHRTARTFQVTGRGGIPGDAVAVTGNLTVTGQTAGGYLSVTPTPTNGPTVSNLNFPVGVNRASLVTATLGPGGKLSIVYVSKPGKTAHVVFDVTGYFTVTGSNGTYHPLEPVRVLDSRIGTGISGQFVAGKRRSWAVAGVFGIPTTATAVTANLTVVRPTSAGFVALFPAAAPTTTTSTLNFRAGDIAANGVAIRLGASGRLSALLGGPAGARVHLVLDVTGYFVNDASGARYVPLTPGRLLDTRESIGLAGRFQAGTGRSLPVAGSLNVPPDAVAINGTLTTVGSTAGGYLSLLSVAANTSETSTLNLLAREVRANGVFGRLSGGSVGILYSSHAGQSTDVVFDLAGYFR